MEIYGHERIFLVGVWQLWDVVNICKHDENRWKAPSHPVAATSSWKSQVLGVHILCLSKYARSPDLSPPTYHHLSMGILIIIDSNNLWWESNMTICFCSILGPWILSPPNPPTILYGISPGYMRGTYHKNETRGAMAILCWFVVYWHHWHHWLFWSSINPSWSDITQVT